jgi:hypothetical protein
MGWVMEKLAKGKPVYGVIVAGEISENLKYAILGVVPLMAAIRA